MRRATVFLILQVLGTGLTAAILTAYIDHTPKTVVTSKVYSEFSGIGERAKALFPKSNVTINDETVLGFYTLTADLFVQSGPQVDKASIVISFQPGLHIFGNMKAVGPSPTITMNCKQVDYEVQCDLSRLAPGDLNHYQLQIATNQRHVSRIYSLDSVVESLPHDRYVDRKVSQFCVLWLCLLSGLFYFGRRFFAWLETRRFHRSLEREDFMIFDSNTDRDALNRAFHDESVHSKR